MSLRTHQTDLVAAVMGAQAVSLAAMSALHLSGNLSGGPGQPRPDGAGIAEGLICVALAAAAVALWRWGTNAEPVALAALVFAIAGFMVGLSFSLSGGSAVDIAYHATVLPLLVGTLVVLRRARPRRPT